MLTALLLRSSWVQGCRMCWYELHNPLLCCNHGCDVEYPVSHRCDACTRFFALCFCLPTWWERALFFAISHAAFGIINLQVCIVFPCNCSSHT